MSRKDAVVSEAVGGMDISNKAGTQWYLKRTEEEKAKKMTRQ